MNIDEYKKRVIELFKSGKATDCQWDAMSKAVLEVSESSENCDVEDIDRVILTTRSREREQHDRTRHITSAFDIAAAVERS